MQYHEDPFIIILPLSVPEWYNSHTDLFLKGIYAENHIAENYNAQLHCSPFEDRCYFTKIQSKHTGNFLSCWVSERGTGYLQPLSSILIKFSKDSLFLQEVLPLVTDFIRMCVGDKLTSPVVTSPV